MRFLANAREPPDKAIRQCASQRVDGWLFRARVFQQRSWRRPVGQIRLPGVDVEEFRGVGVELCQGHAAGEGPIPVGREGHGMILRGRGFGLELPAQPRQHPMEFLVI